MNDQDDSLPDQLADNLKIVFVGTAAGRRSAKVGAYYAHPNNRFWRALHDAGLTARIFAPNEFRDLLPLGFGFTDISKIGVGTDIEVTKEQFDLPGFKRKIERCKPLCVAFTSKKSASIFFSSSKIPYGRIKPKRSDFFEIFVLPSTSGLASKYWDLSPWRELAIWYKAQVAKTENVCGLGVRDETNSGMDENFDTATKNK